MYNLDKTDTQFHYQLKKIVSGRLNLETKPKEGKKYHI